MMEVIGLVWTKKRRGPGSEPCGTPVKNYYFPPPQMYFKDLLELVEFKSGENISGDKQTFSLLSLYKIYIFLSPCT